MNKYRIYYFLSSSFKLSIEFFLLKFDFKRNWSKKINVKVMVTYLDTACYFAHITSLHQKETSKHTIDREPSLSNHTQKKYNLWIPDTTIKTNY